ncbi:hypothetical protein Sste5346_004131 [Sporothrix stenoceras]|uniref:Uncharacterized protein n=1 Tax=Sporothrix stenoceras TaxID=5173 RepID=A0ABR3ZAQ1_9PEZI
MVSSNNNSPFAADAETASVDEKNQNLSTIETATTTTRYLTEKPSKNSMASATVIASTSTSSTHEKNGGRLSTTSITEGMPRTSDLSTPSSVHHNNPFDTDVEAMITHTTSEGTSNGCTGTGTGNSRRSIACRGLGDSQVWPGQAHWKKKAKEQKMKRSCSCLSRLSKRNRLIIKVLIVLLVIGIAVGVGVGISKPLGAPIWGQKNN